MSDEPGPALEVDQPTVYRFRVKGHLGRRWIDWFEGLTIRSEENGETLLSGLVVDQAALHGLLRRIRDAGMTLISVESVNFTGADRPDDPSSEN